MTAEDELRELAVQHPDEFRAFAEKAEEPICGRMLDILAEVDG